MRITKYRTLIKDGLPCLVKEMATNYTTESLTSPDHVMDMLNTVFQHGYETEEVVYLLCFDTKCKPIGIFELSRGTLNLSVMNPREIILKALLCNAKGIIVAHNHPTGDTTPSQTDKDSTQRLKQACDIVGVSLLDSLVISSETYYSFKEANIL